MASVREKRTLERRRSADRGRNSRRGEASSAASRGMAPGRACGSPAGLSFAQLPLFITTAGRHNIDKGLRCLAAEILCDASQVSRLRHTRARTERERVCPPPLPQTHDYPPSRRLFRGDACQRVPRLRPERTGARYYVRESKFTAPLPQSCLLIYRPDERLSHLKEVGIEDWVEGKVIDTNTWLRDSPF